MLFGGSKGDFMEVSRGNQIRVSAKVGAITKAAAMLPFT